MEKSKAIIEIINYPKHGDFIYSKIQDYDKTHLEKLWSKMRIHSEGLLDTAFDNDNEMHILIIEDNTVWAVYNKIVIKREQSNSTFKYDAGDEFKRRVLLLIKSNITG